LKESVGQNTLAPGAQNAGELQANDPVSGKTVWRVPWKVVNNAPVMATAGDLLFQGGPNEGVMRAFNARTGAIVWTFRTGSNFRGSPISYAGPDGRQYIAIIGSQLGPNAQVQPNAAADADVRYRRSGATLYVFALPRAAR
jgi:alcohol dehydrogenase (cytochrome c)